jgi:hypothetical protein
MPRFSAAELDALMSDSGNRSDGATTISGVASLPEEASDGDNDERAREDRAFDLEEERRDLDRAGAMERARAEAKPLPSRARTSVRCSGRTRSREADTRTIKDWVRYVRS